MPTTHHQTLTLTLQLKVSIYSKDPRGMVGEETLRQAIEQYLDDYSDGRYPFAVEQIHDGLRRVIDHSINRAHYNAKYAEHGNEMVQTGKGSWTSRASIEVDALLKASEVGASVYPDVEVPALLKTDEGAFE